ncbi:translation initiation factor Sui1 [Motiliproteus sp. SC1-56]|uniref:translation initiation factor Sui1 n=1 Tax=Motiliproteus sp. SC1-56 TaxID=2799565 RepID=UPI001A8EB881|nr:translation initiation factor Sui1 [Motiliproteus sp. SC1-56]
MKSLKDQLKATGLVYSTEHGRMCPGCGEPKDACICGQEERLPEGDGIVRVSRETKGRKGKGVTLVRGVPLTASDLKQLARELKQRCGTGGSVKDGVIEIQGDQRDLLVSELEGRGFKVKRAGG